MFIIISHPTLVYHYFPNLSCQLALSFNQYCPSGTILICSPLIDPLPSFAINITILMISNQRKTTRALHTPQKCTFTPAGNKSRLLLAAESFFPSKHQYESLRSSLKTKISFWKRKGKRMNR